MIAWPLSDLLDQKGITHIDFWSLDIEDGELNALNGVNWDKHRPTYIMIEVWHRNPEVSKAGGCTGRDGRDVIARAVSFGSQLHPSPRLAHLIFHIARWKRYLQR